MTTTNALLSLVTEYVTADRAQSMNPDVLIQLDETPMEGRHWYAPVTFSILRKTAQIIVPTADRDMTRVVKRLSQMAPHLVGIEHFLEKYCGVSADWHVSFWIFHRPDALPQALKAINALEIPTKFTSLHKMLPGSVNPWTHKHAA